ncbi:MAG: hypothetical protein U1B80_06770 [Anaerolineaceae bacterium]|nr:hypothetical protein [Anaerolineaceae bacterium]
MHDDVLSLFEDLTYEQVKRMRPEVIKRLRELRAEIIRTPPQAIDEWMRAQPEVNSRVNNTRAKPYTETKKRQSR